ncbi:hypothetical protein C4K38_6060 [Pseudomonas chlororaphis subsp. piscium]|nr:hypothetical protein C4K38_6060 [Pseudomonas chlororaphis subsp. piscium]SDS13338.1 hypothetical protein SAMN05216585_1323 [Pseudomonas chlororaphis]
MSIPVQPYYGSDAYRLDRVPEQTASTERGWLSKFSGTRLPWGNTQEVAPDSIMEDPKPESMRFWEQWEKEKAEMKANDTYVPRPLEHIDLHYKYDHERFRFAQLPFRSQFWLYMKGIGKWAFIILAPITVLAHLTVMPASVETPWNFTYDLLVNLYSWMLGVPLLCGVIGHIVVNHFPKFWFRPPKGPLWELNRRTGLVTFFDYKHFKKDGVIDEVVAPFYEFDAYIVTSPDRQGLAMNGLFLIHRYRDIRINLNNLIIPDNTTQRPCALWDFLQNFMDVSRPLPELPLYEPYRHLDPVTAEYDRRIGRKPRYWIDMDNDTFKAKVKEMLGRIDAIDTFSRPNLMTKHVKYVD